jgi:hypothetical protein
MGSYETTTRATKVVYPPDLPKAEAAVAEGHPDGIVFRAANGQRFKLVDKEAYWKPLVERKANNNKKPAAKR